MSKTPLDEFDVTAVIDGLQATIHNALDTVAPMSTVYTSKRKVPWLTPELKLSIKKRNQLHKLAKRTNSLLNYEIYRRYRSELSSKIKQVKQQFYQNKLSTIKDSATLWRVLSSLGLIRQSTSSPLHYFTTNQLIEYYSSITSNTNQCTQADLDRAINLSHHGSSHLEFTCIDPIEVYQLILSSVSNTHSTGPDSISASTIRLLSRSLVHVLSSIFNFGIQNSFFPAEWKKAYLRPLSKINMPRSPSDTRPIANLCEFSKLYERIIHKQIIQYLTSNNLLDPLQSGYRKSYSTQTALLKLCHDVRKSADNRRLTILVLFDFSKAFDMVPHAKLLTKLASIGFSSSSLTWIHSYLTGRLQCVDDDAKTRSDWATIDVGVPQGSVLGPILFSLFINDIGVDLLYCKHLVFADDTQIYLDCLPSELDQALIHLKYDINVIANYSEENGLKLNLTKSKVIILGSPAYINAIDQNKLIDLTVNTSTIPYVNQARNLGVILQSNLSWRKNVLNISSRVHATLHKLKYNKNSFSTELRTKLVYTLIFPLIDYCCVVYNDLTAELNAKLQRLVNCTIRYIFNLRRDEHITPYRLKLKWLSVQNRRLYFIGIMVYNILHQSAPKYLVDIFEMKRDGIRSSSSLINTETFHIPLHRTSLYANSFHLIGVYLWHSLPTTITESESLPVFKDRLYKYYLERESSM
ncbi:hypothetical protein PV328_011098 [Microctonus aethiopoides]|uniref:Reverse transcriptase domain-containing protein n=1 Tax=Microctonus aethiopoides TaxID=144406 RepID=A0AA39C3Q6_9HYME|nr:hypothetical protein PV328_011098 [Microctonus aethiopoides]